MLELYESTSSLKLSDTFAEDQRKRIEASDAKAGAGAGAVTFGTGLAQVEEVLNVLLQVDPARRLTAQAVYDKPFSFFANPPIDGCKSADIPSKRLESGSRVRPIGFRTQPVFVRLTRTPFVFVCCVYGLLMRLDLSPPPPSPPAAPVHSVPAASALTSAAASAAAAAPAPSAGATAAAIGAVCLELGCECRAAGAGCRCSGHSHR